MENNTGVRKSPITFGFAVIASVCASLVAAQDIVPVSDIGGGTSVFVFRGASRAVAKKFVSQGRTRRTKSQRMETAKKVTTQYATLSKTAPRRTRIAAVDPNDTRMIRIKTMPREEASKLFAGVGEYYMDQNNYDRAIDFFREAMELDKLNTVAKSGLSEALALKGNELLAKDSFPVARKFFEEALIYNDKNAPAYFGLAEVQTELNDEGEAAKNYEKALSFDGDLTEIYLPLGILYFQAGDITKAESFITRAEALNPNEAQTQYYLGLIRLAQENRDREALTALNKAKTLDPTMAEAFYNAGQANSRLNNNKEAVQDFTKAVSLRDNYFEAWFGLGSAQFEMNNYDAAITAYERAKRLKNDNAEVVANLGDVYRQKGEFDKAESNYNLAGLFFERQKDFATNKEQREIAAETYGKVGFAIAKQCEKNIVKRLPCNWGAAVKALEKAVSLTNSPTEQANLGWVLHNAGREDLAAGRTAQGREKLTRARDVLQKAVVSNTKNLEGPLLNLGMAYTDLGDHKSAIETFKKVIQKEPKWVFAINELGIAYLNDGNTKEAIAQFKKAVDRDNKFAAAYFNLAKAEFKNGNLGEAKKAHSKLKSLGAVGAGLANRLTFETGGAVTS
ncbi:MAG TPA: tetratricopeptide repeat protein [Pyrinomonadaceae bacterium]|jgi:tetratricopeptide (TPR) repeat protein|nr:tetratricopeptide repeat protein [Pyrinomonadaceae bacterium]